MATAPLRKALYAPTQAGRIAQPAPPEQDVTAPGLREALWIWGLLGALSLAVLITYTRFPVSEFYHVSIDGFRGGLSRTLVLINFPIAFIGLALMGIAVARLYSIPGALSGGERWLVGVIASLATGLSLVAAFVVRQADLDAKPSNAIPAIGVVLALGLTLFTVRRTGVGSSQPWQPSDTVRLVLILALSVAALPWILADLGVFVGNIPLIGRIYMSTEILPGETQAAVHLGHHHGFDGVIFAASAIVLSRQFGALRGVLRWPMTAYVALMLVYGLANGLQDFWGEQLVKRGWTDTHVPTVAEPKLTVAWGLILLTTALITIIMLTVVSPNRNGRSQPTLIA